jgi:hypothetical protein
MNFLKYHLPGIRKNKNKNKYQRNSQVFAVSGLIRSHVLKDLGLHCDLGTDHLHVPNQGMNSPRPQMVEEMIQ